MHKSPDLIGSAEAAEMLRIDRSTLNRQIRSGVVTPFAKGSGHTGEYLFERSYIESIAPVDTAPPAASTGASSIGGAAA